MAVSLLLLLLLASHDAAAGGRMMAAADGANGSADGGYVAGAGRALLYQRSAWPACKILPGHHKRHQGLLCPWARSCRSGQYRGTESPRAAGLMPGAFAPLDDGVDGDDARRARADHLVTLTGIAADIVIALSGIDARVARQVGAAANGDRTVEVTYAFLAWLILGACIVGHDGIPQNGAAQIFRWLVKPEKLSDTLEFAHASGIELDDVTPGVAKARITAHARASKADAAAPIHLADTDWYEVELGPEVVEPDAEVQRIRRRR